MPARRRPSVVGGIDPEDARGRWGTMSMAWTYWCRGPDPRLGAGGPVHDQRIGDPALVDLPLPSAERRVAGDRPSPRVVVVAEGPADLVDPAERLLDRTGCDVPRPDVVDRADGPALRAGTVVRQHDDERVVEVARAVEEVDEPAELVVGVGEEAGEGLHVAGVQAPGVVGQRVPRRDPLRTGRQLRARGKQPLGQLAGEGRPPASASHPRSNRPAVAVDPRAAAPGGASGTRPGRGRGRTACPQSTARRSDT